MEKTLKFEFPERLEHELFRSCMQACVALTQDGWSKEARARAAKDLETKALKYVGFTQFAVKG